MNQAFVENGILRLCIQPRTFEFISKRLHGLDPIKVNEALTSLVAEKKLIKKEDLWVINEKIKDTALTLGFEIPDPQLYLKKYMGHFDFLKMPHPLDYEWRNSTSSLNYLTDQILQTNTLNDSVLILGMPTLFANVCIRDIPQKVSLVERNKPIVKALKKLAGEKNRFNVIEADVFKTDPAKVGKYHSVFMDPPWYSEHFYQFIWLAARCIEVGGFLTISIPPLNTRPGIDKERIDWFSFCQQQGLCLENLYAQKLEYAMPFFEFNAFRSAGIQNILPFWRKGDVAIFRKINDHKVDRPDFEEATPNWQEREIDTVRIRVKVDNKANKNEKLVIEHLVKSDILPTVSTRDDRRKVANVWTSGNRIFHVTNTDLFLKTLDEIIESKRKFTAEKKNVSDLVTLITGFEKKEYNNYLDWLYHEMERQTD
jgi:hypothetical protein